MDVSLFQYHRSGIVKSLSLYLTITYSQPMNEQTETWISWGISAMNRILSTSMTLKIWGTSAYGYFLLRIPYYVLCWSFYFLCLLIANEKTKCMITTQANPDYKGVCHIALAQEGHCRPGEVNNLRQYPHCQDILICMCICFNFMKFVCLFPGFGGYRLSHMYCWSFRAIRHWDWQYWCWFCVGYWQDSAQGMWFLPLWDAVLDLQLCCLILLAIWNS